jgi:hypothetical protein
MSAKSPFHVFSDNTQFVCVVTSIALFVLLVTMVAPTGMGRFNLGLGKVISIALLSYALVVNCKETNALTSSVPGIFEDSTLSGQRNNVILSYILSAASLGLVLYVIFTFFS